MGRASRPKQDRLFTSTVDVTHATIGPRPGEVEDLNRLLAITPEQSTEIGRTSMEYIERAPVAQRDQMDATLFETQARFERLAHFLPDGTRLEQKVGTTPRGTIRAL